MTTVNSLGRSVSANPNAYNSFNALNSDFNYSDNSINGIAGLGEWQPGYSYNDVYGGTKIQGLSGSFNGNSLFGTCYSSGPGSNCISVGGPDILSRPSANVNNYQTVFERSAKSYRDEGTLSKFKLPGYVGAVDIDDDCLPDWAIYAGGAALLILIAYLLMK